MKRRTILILIAAVLVAGIVCFFVFRETGQYAVNDPYADAVRNGYSGTTEEWIAALVGETVPGSESAFSLAQQKGYKESLAHWMQSLTGKTSEDPTISAFELMQKNGYRGSLTEWLTSLVKEPEKLGHSETADKTDYELACEYGFTGTFIDWMVSLISN